MKKLIVSIIILIMSTSSAFGANPDLGKIETYLFGYEYKTETETKRLDRVETYIYGKVTKEQNPIRLARINKDLNMKAEDQEKIAKAQSEGNATLDHTPEYLPKSDASVKYPIVDKIEQKVLLKTYAEEDVYKRIDRLERKLFTKPMTGDLNDRVDKLKTAAKIKDTIATEDGYDSEAVASGGYGSSGYNYYSPNSMPQSMTGGAAPAKQSMPDYNNQNNYGNGYNSGSSNYNNTNITYDLSPIEKSILNKSYPNEASTTRLNRLENKIFGITFSKDDFDTRAQRITAAAAAQKSTGYYDNNKMMRSINTGIQVGSFLLYILTMFL